MSFTNLNKRLKYSRNSTPNKKNRFKILFIFLIVLAAIYLPIRGVYSSVTGLVVLGRAVNEAFKNENLDDIRKNLKEMKGESDKLGWSLNFLAWMRIVPYFGGFYADAKHFSDAASYELNVVSKIADSLDPYKGELGFNGHPAPGQDRVTQFVKIMNKVIPDLDKYEPELKKASGVVSSIDVGKYPEKWGDRVLRSRVDTAKNFITGAYYAVSKARDALEVAPQALGEPEAKTYLIIFQNDKEIRATGGFMTAYAYLKLDKGRVSSSQSDDIYRLDEKLLEVCRSVICPLTPPEAISKYLPEANGKPRSAWSMRDSNFSPDGPTSLKQFEKLYSFLGGESFDGIILIDTHVVEELIKVTGSVEVFGTSFSADHDKRCNCPNVIYELENYAQIIEKGEKDRKAILGTLMQQILARSLGASAEKLPEFINVGVRMAQGKHMLFYMHDRRTQEALSQLNWTGEIKNTDGDYLHINDSNFAGGKSNLYVEEEVSLEINPKSGQHKLTINYKNPQAYNIWLNGINRDYVRVYVPKGSKLLKSKGSEAKVNEFEELEKSVFDAFVQVRPQNSVKLEFEYEVPVKKDGDYPILIQKQPGTKDFKYTVKVTGKGMSFKLDKDKKLKF